MRDIIAGKLYHSTGSDTESRLSDIELKISSSDDDDTSSKSPDVKLIPNEITVIDISDSSNDTSSRGTFDLIIPPPIDFQGSCFKKIDEIVTSSTSSSTVTSKLTSSSIIIEKSPSSSLPTSNGKPFIISQIVISPPKALNMEADVGVNHYNPICKNFPSNVDTPIVTSPAKSWCFPPVTTPSVVTSSVVTPTLLSSDVIKTSELVTSTVQEAVSSTSSCLSESSLASSYFPSVSTPAAPPLYRIVNRQLSAKDIIIGPNNEVKRRKISRKKLSLVRFFLKFDYYTQRGESKTIKYN